MREEGPSEEFRNRKTIAAAAAVAVAAVAAAGPAPPPRLGASPPRSFRASTRRRI